MYSKLIDVFDKLYKNATLFSLETGRTVAALNALCAFVDQIALSSDEGVRKSLASLVWDRLFSFYIRHAHFVPPKSSRQLLNSLSLLLRSVPQSHELLERSDRVAKPLIIGLKTSDDYGRAKWCVLALSNFLTKDVLSIHAILEAMPIHTAEPGLSGKLEQLFAILFDWLSKGDFGSTIARLVSVILDQLSHRHVTDHESNYDTPMWANALQESAGAHGNNVAKLKTHLFPTLFKRDSQDFVSFLERLNIGQLRPNQPDAVLGTISRSSTTDRELLFASLRAGKDIGMLYETDEDELTLEDSIIYLPIEWIGRLLVWNDKDARLTGLSLLVSSHAATRPFFESGLRLIKLNLSYLFVDTDANFRSEVCNLIQRLVDRVRAITAVLARQIPKDTMNGVSSVSSSPARILMYHKSFLEWLIGFMHWELGPTASYQRHTSALRCLSIVSKSGLDEQVDRCNYAKSALGETCWPFHLNVIDNKSYSLLLNLLLDPFDDVRQISASILMLYPSVLHSEIYRLKFACKQAEGKMLLTGRADHADGSAHLYSLLEAQLNNQSDLPGHLSQLEQMIDIARADLSQAVQRYPIHGLLTTIRYILCRSSRSNSGHLDLVRRTVCCVENIWHIVRPILCNDAPEGYLPDNFEETAELTTKNALSYCWRALKEASILSDALIASKPTCSYALDLGQRRCLSELCFTQLAELRHRGAFSTVAQTWVTCCLNSALIPFTSGQTVLEIWYERVLSILQNNTTINTRRSAGLPSLLCGILIGDRSGKMMKQTLVDLEKIARSPVDPALLHRGGLSQVHSMNCIKDILKNSKLGDQSEPYVSITFRLAVDALYSNVWAVSNCGLMLFRAVIDRLLGTSDAQLENEAVLQRTLSIDHYPELFEGVLNLLSLNAARQDERTLGKFEGAFPALQLLLRLCIPQEHILSTRELVKVLMGSSAWHVRDMAACTYSSFVNMNDFLQELEMLLQPTSENQNSIHGSLLAAKHLVHRLKNSRGQDATSMAIGVFSIANAAATNLYHSNLCPVTKAAYLDLHTECYILETAKIASKSTQSSGRLSQITQTDVFSINVICDELQQTISGYGNYKTAIQALLRKPLARALGMKLINYSSPNERLLPLLQDLSICDPNATAAFFEEAHSLISQQSAHISSAGLEILMQAAFVMLDVSECHSKIRVEAQRLILQAEDRLCFANEPNITFSTFISKKLHEPNPVRAMSSGIDADLALVLQGLYIEYHIRYSLGNAELYSAIARWANSCCSAVVSDTFYSRHAAAISFSRMKLTWHVLPGLQELDSKFLRLCYALYDLLNDDDEDIRLITSQAVSCVLGKDGVPYRDSVPPVASNKLLGYMLQRWRSNSDFASEAFHRCFGISQTYAPDFLGILNACAQSSRALFAEEKQNLYLDEAREVRAWSRILLQISPNAIQSSLKDSLAVWVEKGLLLYTGEENSNVEGFLGCSMEPEIFVLGLQIIYGAELLFHWLELGWRIASRPSSIRKELAILAVKCEMHSSNMLWRKEIRRILGDTVIHKIQLLHGALSKVIIDLK